MGTVKVKRLRQKGGRYFWEPTLAVCRLGFAPEALGKDLAKAVHRAERLNAEVEAAARGTVALPVDDESITALIRLYEADYAFLKLKPKSRRAYGVVLKEIDRKMGRFPVAMIDRKYLKSIYRGLQDRGKGTASLHMSVWRVLLDFAREEGWRGDNPALGMRVERPQARDSVWGEEQITRFCALAVERGRPSMALAVQLAYHLGQRQGDILRLSRSLWDGHAFTIRQEKTDAVVIVPATAALRAVLEERRAASVQIVVNEHTGRAYTEATFRDVFAEIRAAAGLPAQLQFRDLRRTAVVRLARAGCTVAEIVAVTGHTLKSADTILRHYLPRDSTVARNAIAKLERKGES